MTRRELLCATVGLAFSPGVAPPIGVRLLVPAYFYPSGEGLRAWDRLIASAKKAPILAIANPASGPGARVDPAYTDVLDRSKRAGLTLLGYVSTHYAERTAEQAREDLALWKRFYPQVSGVFFDEQSSGEEKLVHYRELARLARAAYPGGTIVANPGTTCAEAYLKERTCDVSCLYEASRGMGAFRPPAWIAGYPPDRVAAIVYDVPGWGEARPLCRNLRESGAGVLFVTDAKGANPYDRLPSYWDDLVAWAGSHRPGREDR